jgi:hypothetical protein
MVSFHCVEVEVVVGVIAAWIGTCQALGTRSAQFFPPDGHEEQSYINDSCQKVCIIVDLLTLGEVRPCQIDIAPNAVWIGRTTDIQS